MTNTIVDRLRNVVVDNDPSVKVTQDKVVHYKEQPIEDYDQNYREKPVTPKHTSSAVESSMMMSPNTEEIMPSSLKDVLRKIRSQKNSENHITDSQRFSSKMSDTFSDSSRSSRSSSINSTKPIRITLDDRPPSHVTKSQEQFTNPVRISKLSDVYHLKEDEDRSKRTATHKHNGTNVPKMTSNALDQDLVTHEVRISSRPVNNHQSTTSRTEEVVVFRRTDPQGKKLKEREKGW
ncbi:hypothetical protein AKO1_003386, partial [Acrasis kona]